MITIKEIAKQLQLSTTTVSNVIHGKTGEVSADTIERVQKFLDEVEYIPNINARNLAQNESKIIGVAFKTQPDKYDYILADPFVSELLGSIEKRIREAGYFMMLYISDDIAEIMRYVSTWNVDGLLLYYMLDDDGMRVSKKYSKPIVCIDNYDVRGLEHYINIGLEDEQGAYDMVKYLIECGHRRIGFLSDNRIGVDLARFRGYRRALEDNGIEYSDRNFFMLHPRNDEIAGSFDRLCRQAEEFTAVFCVSDLYAARFMAALKDRGFKIPEDISIAGFDDNIFAEIVRPQLTTMHQDVEERGRIVVDTLLRAIHGEEIPERQFIQKTRLVVRDSVRKLN